MLFVRKLVFSKIRKLLFLVENLEHRKIIKQSIDNI